MDNIKVPMNLEAIISNPAEALILLKKQEEMNNLFTKEIESLKGQIEWLKRQLFGRKSERFFNPNQLCFDSILIEAIDNKPPEEPDEAVGTRVAAHERKITPHGRGILPEHLERVVEEIDIPEEQKVLSDGRERPRIGYDDSEKLVFEPGRFWVKVTRRYKYGAPMDSKEEESGVIQASVPDTLLSRCLADDTLLAHVAVSKYGDHLPLYRLESIFKRSGIRIARQTMCGWMQGLGIALGPLVGEIKRELFKTGMVHSDDTTVELLEPDERKPQSKNIRTARMWVSCAGQRDGPWTVFDFTVTREAEGPKRFFGDYSGKIICDAYSGYGVLAEKGDSEQEIILYACWAHARRYFFNAYKGGDRKVGAEFIALIKLLYDVEADIKDKKQYDEILVERQKRSRPIIENVKDKIDTLLPITPPKSLLGKALNYATNNWKRLIRYVDDPQADIDNNVAENAIRPIALGRKNWLFIGNRTSGEAAANIMSIICTCKRAGVDPYAYMLDVIRRLPSTKLTELGSLLPTNWIKPQTPA